MQKYNAYNALFWWMISTYLYHAKNVQQLNLSYSVCQQKPACPKLADNENFVGIFKKMKELLYLLLVNQVWSLHRQGKTRRFYLRSYFFLEGK